MRNKSKLMVVMCVEIAIMAIEYAKNYTVYGAANRLVNLNNWTVREDAQPQFKCPNEENDLFTTSSSTKGNKALTNPIGLLTADEVAYAGGVYQGSSESMYLIGSFIWTMSPFGFYSRNNGDAASVWYMDDGGWADSSIAKTTSAPLRFVPSSTLNLLLNY